MSRRPGFASAAVLAGSLLIAQACAPEEIAVEPPGADTVLLGAFRTDAARSGSAAGEIGGDPRTTYRVEGVEPVIASPVLAGGAVFIPDGDGDLLAFEPDSGQILWRSSIGDADASVVVSGDSVFTMSSAAAVRRHDIGTGDMIWEVELDGSARSSPLLAEGRLLVVAGGVLHVLDPSDGSQVAGVDLEGTVDSSPAYVHGTIVVGTADDRLAFVDLESLSTSFLALPPADHPLTTYADGVAATPVIVDDMVYVGSTSGLLVATEITGDLIWQSDLGSPIYGTAAIGSAVGYVPTAAGTLVAFERSSGETVWESDLGDASYSSPLVVDEVVIVTAENGMLFAFDAASGEPLWSIEIGEPGNYMASSPVVSGSIVIVGSNDGSIVGVATDG